MSLGEADTFWLGWGLYQSGSEDFCHSKERRRRRRGRRDHSCFISVSEKKEANCLAEIWPVSQEQIRDDLTPSFLPSSSCSPSNSAISTCSGEDFNLEEAGWVNLNSQLDNGLSFSDTLGDPSAPI